MQANGQRNPMGGTYNSPMSSDAYRTTEKKNEKLKYILYTPYRSFHLSLVNWPQTACWQAGRLAGWQAGRLAGWQAGRLAGWQALGVSGDCRPSMGRRPPVHRPTSVFRQTRRQGDEEGVTADGLEQRAVGTRLRKVFRDVITCD